MTEPTIEGKPRRRRRVLGLDADQRHEERRRLLLQAALELFGTRGFAKTSIEMLCSSAGIGTNSFYLLFSNKEEVLAALYDQITTDLRDTVAESYLANRNEPDVVRSMVSSFVHRAADDARVAQVAFIEAAGVSPEVEEHRRRARNEFVAGIEAIGRDLRPAAEPTSPESTGPSPRRNALAIVGTIIETTVDWLHDPNADDIEQLIDDIAQQCRRLLAAIIDERRAAQGSELAEHSPTQA